ncbi:CopD family protein [uncultured Mycolicibacterium sp.]|uniref:CopD family protein n=1 Tax=uncultured Mycolicibacterium sp. TaxID=2320817 RepID=UPI0026236994|nr:CopD family protein [uncultured Mycolicibacterium sp.]
MLRTVLAASNVPGPAPTQVLVEICSVLAPALATAVALTVVGLGGARLAGQARALAAPAAGFVALAALLDYLWAASRFAKTGLVSALRPEVLNAFLHAPGARGNVVGAGVVALIQLGLKAGLVGALLVLHRRGGRAAARVALAAALVVTVAPALPFAPPSVDRLAHSGLTAMHLAGTTLWVGPVLLLAVIGWRQRRHRPTDARAEALEWTRAWERVSALALCAVGMLVVSGSWLAWTHVGTVGQLFTTPYGRALALKLAVTVVLVGIGAYNLWVLLPRLRAALADGAGTGAFRLAARHFPAVVGVESVLMVVVLGIVPFLAGSARAQAGWPAAGPFDASVFGTGVAVLAATALPLWAAARAGRARARPEPVRP